jgi:hypothetical protein
MGDMVFSQPWPLPARSRTRGISSHVTLLLQSSANCLTAGPARECNYRPIKGGPHKALYGRNHVRGPTDEGWLSGVTLYTFNFPYYLTPPFLQILPPPNPFLQPSFLCFPQFGSQARYVLGSLHDLCLFAIVPAGAAGRDDASLLSGRPWRSTRIQLLDLSHILEGCTLAFMET